MSRRGFLVKVTQVAYKLIGGAGLRALFGLLPLTSSTSVMAASNIDTPPEPAAGVRSTVGEREGESDRVSLFLCGDVMTGRGIDQVLPHPSDPRIYEPYMTDATGYVELAERASGPIPKPVPFPYIWGDALDELEGRTPDVRMINLETAVTTSDAFWPGKGINYRMHPKNIGCLTAAQIDCCVLANNHVLDWGRVGLAETLETLRRAGIAPVGAGEDVGAASAPAVLQGDGPGRVLVFAFGAESSGIPWDWAAGDGRSGVNLLSDFSAGTLRRISGAVRDAKRPGDIVVASIHWGGNWGYRIPREQVRFAHALLDEVGVDIVHGHSSHHPKGIEVHGGKLIVYGCGDFLNDYEGIGGYEQFRGDLALMYFVNVDRSTGRLAQLDMVPMRVRRFRTQRATSEDAEWLRATLDREGQRLGTRVARGPDNTLRLLWDRT